MGNTISIAPNILVFPSPEPSRRVHGFVHTASTHPVGVPTPSKPGKPASTHLVHADTQREARLTRYAILPNVRPTVVSLLTSLTTSLRTRTDTSIMPLSLLSCVPRTIFLTSGEFQNELSNTVLSILFDPETRHGNTAASHYTFLHIYDSAHLAQPFDALLTEWVYKGLVGKGQSVEQDVELVGRMEACGMTVIKRWIEGRGEEGSGVDARMVGVFEGLLLGFWMEGGDRDGNSGTGVGTEEMGSGCVPS
ncbi:hypothetical protein BDW02DRAFT_569982 [Decorospora gaudefroyi]|uniref:Uncharacterized protein n=1 Tax=Decorospora gaudefroyi TaxID=184978 RepID=A0A6A5KBD7_9PLEO|nr:hypothetical protein BDW02DRAFT_569982 [Decorospora gaudefroyi]